MTTEKQPENLSFSEVLEFIRYGNNIAYRPDWKDTFIIMKELNDYGQLFIKHNTEAKTKEIYAINHQDILAKDWKVQFHDMDTEIVQVTDTTETNNIELSLDGSEETIIKSPSNVIYEEGPMIKDIDGNDLEPLRIERVKPEEEIPELHEGGPVPDFDPEDAKVPYKNHGKTVKLRPEDNTGSGGLHRGGLDDAELQIKDENAGDDEPKEELDKLKKQTSEEESEEDEFSGRL